MSPSSAAPVFCRAKSVKNLSVFQMACQRGCKIKIPKIALRDMQYTTLSLFFHLGSNYWLQNFTESATLSRGSWALTTSWDFHPIPKISNCETQLYHKLLFCQEKISQSQTYNLCYLIRNYYFVFSIYLNIHYFLIQQSAQLFSGYMFSRLLYRITLLKLSGSQ